MRVFILIALLFAFTADSQINLAFAVDAHHIASEHGTHHSNHVDDEPCHSDHQQNQCDDCCCIHSHTQASVSEQEEKQYQSNHYITFMIAENMHSAELSSIKPPPRI